jgi:outer membrane receptor for ferric coprogen and ferric-rhodotorulic acid
VYRNSIKNMPLMVSNFNAEGNKFAVIYDDGKARVNGFNGELDFKATDDFNIFGRIEIKDYQMASEKEPWNLPKFLLTAGTAIHIDSKFTVTGSLLIRGSTTDRLLVLDPANPSSGPLVYNQVKQSIKGFGDLSGSVEYRINSKFSVFAQANNILSSSYQNWLYYPNYGFNIFGGVGYSF